MLIDVFPCTIVYMKEEWRPVPGYEDRYEVSNLGRVRSTRILNPWTMTSGGYKCITIKVDGKNKVFRVHRWVLEAFVGPCPPGQEALHANDLPDDNRVENLSWGTRKQNVSDRINRIGHHQSNKTHCPSGHEYTEENTYLLGNHRYCRECQKVHRKNHRDKKKGLDTKCPTGCPMEGIPHGHTPRP